jgi:flagellar biosynthesis/type III secretory pathway protein FliH
MSARSVIEKEAEKKKQSFISRIFVGNVEKRKQEEQFKERLKEARRQGYEQGALKTARAEGEKQGARAALPISRKIGRGINALSAGINASSMMFSNELMMKPPKKPVHKKKKKKEPENKRSTYSLF